MAVGGQHRVEPLEQRQLELHVLRHRLEDEVAALRGGEVGGGRDARHGGLDLRRLEQPLGREDAHGFADARERGGEARLAPPDQAHLVASLGEHIRHAVPDDAVAEDRDGHGVRLPLQASLEQPPRAWNRRRP